MSTSREWEQEERGREVIQEVSPLKSLGKVRIEACVKCVMCPVPGVRDDLDERPISASTASPGAPGLRPSRLRTEEAGRWRTSVPMRCLGRSYAKKRIKLIIAMT